MIYTTFVRLDQASILESLDFNPDVNIRKKNEIYIYMCVCVQPPDEVKWFMFLARRRLINAWNAIFSPAAAAVVKRGSRERVTKSQGLSDDPLLYTFFTLYSHAQTRRRVHARGFARIAVRVCVCVYSYLHPRRLRCFAADAALILIRI